MRRAKIVCTLGPATDDALMIDRMIAAGMNMARLNLSHGAREGHEKTFEMVRKAAAKADADRATAKQAVLDRLGITANEAALLLG